MSVDGIRAYMEKYDEIWGELNGYSPLAVIIHNLLDKIEVDYLDTFCK